MGEDIIITHCIKMEEMPLKSLVTLDVHTLDRINIDTPNE